MWLKATVPFAVAAASNFWNWPACQVSSLSSKYDNFIKVKTMLCLRTIEMAGKSDDVDVIAEALDESKAKWVRIAIVKHPDEFFISQPSASLYQRLGKHFAHAQCKDI